MLNSLIMDNEILPSGFNLYRKDRTTRGGGVMLAVSSKFFSKLVFSPDNLELLTISLTSGHCEFIYYLSTLYSTKLWRAVSFRCS